jgi:hypothetical protein
MDTIQFSQTEPATPEPVYTSERPRGLEFDDNGQVSGSVPASAYFDKLDKDFVAFYGEEGRRLVNARRARWNKQGLWLYDML